MGCDGLTTARRLAQRLTEEYEVEMDTALDHVHQLTAFFAENDLIGLGTGK